MSDSSDSEIIQRSRYHKKPSKKIYETFSDSDDYSNGSNPDNIYINPLFAEIFGNGDEYAYIYNDKVNEEADINKEIEFEVNLNECYEYVKKRIPPFGFRDVNYESVKSLIDGVCVEFLAYHRDCFTVTEGYYVFDVIGDYFSRRNNLKSCDLNIPGILNISQLVENLLFLEKKHQPYGNIECVGGKCLKCAAGKYLECVHCKTERDKTRLSNNIMNINGKNGQICDEDNKSKYEEIYNNSEKGDKDKNDHKEYIKDTEKVKTDCRKYVEAINQISNNSVFRETVEIFHEFQKMGVFYNTEFDPKSIFNFYITDNLKKNNKIHNDGYPSNNNSANDSCDNSNEANNNSRNISNNDIRRIIIEKAFSKVNVNFEKIKARLNLHGYCDYSNSLNCLFDNLHNFVNFLFSIAALPSSSDNAVCAGIFYEKGSSTVILVDKNGEKIKQATFRSNDIAGIEEYVTDAIFICITSKVSAVRNFIWRFPRKLFYVPSKLLFFNTKPYKKDSLKNSKDQTLAYDVALLVQNPLIYFSKIISRSITDLNFSVCGNSDAKDNHKLTENYKSIDKPKFSDKLKHNGKLNESDYSNICKYFNGCNNSIEEIIRRGIRIVAGWIKPDWRQTLDYKDSHALFNVLGITLDADYFDYRGIDRFDKLLEVCSNIQYNNICTYFTLKDSGCIFDRTYIHPCDYSMANMIFRSAYNLKYGDVSNKSSEEIADWALQNKNVFLELKFSEILKDTKIKNIAQEKINNIESPKETLITTIEEDGLTRIINEFIRSTGQFSFIGANDMQIFEDLVPEKKLGLAHGRISRIENDYMIVNSDGALIYVNRKDTDIKNANSYNTDFSDYSLNDEVTVNIKKFCYDKLNYSGELVINKNLQNSSSYKFTHKLLIPLDQISIERYMNDKNQNVAIRYSSQTDGYVVVCRINPHIFWKMYITQEHGLRENTFRYNNSKFNSIDDFLENYVSYCLQTIHKITQFKYFFQRRNDAIAYVAEGHTDKYMRYAICFSTTNPGCVEFIYRNKSVLVLLDGKYILYRDQKFKDIEDFINYAKRNFH